MRRRYDYNKDRKSNINKENIQVEEYHKEVKRQVELHWQSRQGKSTEIGKVE